MEAAEPQLETAACPDPEPGNPENPHRAGGNDANQDAVLADSALARRCREGEPAAWEEFYARCHRPLLVSIEVMLGPGRADRNLADEIAARVWYALIENDGKLLARYHPRRGARLITFLRSVAKTEVCRHLRRKRRRQRRERIALAGRPAHQPADHAQTAASLREFVPTLTAGEREFYEDHLAGRPAGGAGDAARKPLSASARQLAHRIREKLLRFLGYGR